MEIAVTVGKQIRNLLLAAASAVERLGGKVPARSQLGPFQHLNEGTFDRIIGAMRLNPRLLLQIRDVRQILARERVVNLMAAKKLARVEGGSNISHNTVDYNIQGALMAPALDRPAVMVNVVTSIERVWKNISELDVLSIGPRSEIEIFAILAAGFQESRIKALDLFSYSPYVQTGDMHAMPFPDASFDVVFVGWVLSYSRNQAEAAQEIFRVCRDRAIVVIAGDYSDDTRDRSTFKNDTTHMQSTNQILGLFEGHVGNIYFRHDPEQPQISMAMTVFEVRK
jgi:hypothetical protein